MREESELDQLRRWASQEPSIGPEEASRRVVESLPAMTAPPARRRWPIAAAFGLALLTVLTLVGFAVVRSGRSDLDPIRTVSDDRGDSSPRTTRAASGSVVVIPLESGSTLFYAAQSRSKPNEGEADVPANF